MASARQQPEGRIRKPSVWNDIACTVHVYRLTRLSTITHTHSWFIYSRRIVDRLWNLCTVISHSGMFSFKLMTFMKLILCLSCLWSLWRRKMCKNYIVACRKFHDFVEEGVVTVVLLLRNIVWEFLMALNVLVRLKHGELLNNKQEVLMRFSGKEEEEYFGKNEIPVYDFLICTPLLFVGMCVLFCLL